MPIRMIFGLQIATVIAGVGFLASHSASAQNSEFPFCFDGSFKSIDGSTSYDFLDLVIDADPLVGKELVIVSHVAILGQDTKEIKGEVGPIDCNPMFGRAMVKKGGLAFVVSPELLGSLEDYKRIRRSLLENTDSFKSLSLFQLTGVVSVYSDTFEPFIQVKDLMPIRSVD